MSDISSSTQSVDEEVSFCQQGTGLGNVLSVSNSSTHLPHFKKTRPKSKPLSKKPDQSSLDTTPKFKRQIGFGKRKRRRTSRKFRKASKKTQHQPFQIGQGSRRRKRKSNRNRLRKFYALRRAPF